MERPMAAPLYPEVHVSLRSRNRFAVASAVRQALRRAGKERSDIERFTREALAAPDAQLCFEICRRWVALSTPA